MTLPGWVGVREPRGRLGGAVREKRYNLSHPGVHYTFKASTDGASRNVRQLYLFLFGGPLPASETGRTVGVSLLGVFAQGRAAAHPSQLATHSAGSVT